MSICGRYVFGVSWKFMVKITIDGAAASGKSSLASMLAQQFDILQIETGMFYRGVAHCFMCVVGRLPAEHELDLNIIDNNLEFVASSTNGTKLVSCFIQGVDVTKMLRSEVVAMAAANIAHFVVLRSWVSDYVRKLALTNSVVIEGRDTGTKVFPEADYKFFLRASLDVRSKRRMQEVLQNHPGYMQDSSKEEILNNIKRDIHIRDSIDTTRAAGPLVCPDNAVEIDVNDMDAQDVVEFVSRYVKSAMETDKKTFDNVRQGDVGKTNKVFETGVTHLPRGVYDMIPRGKEDLYGAGYINSAAINFVENKVREFCARVGLQEIRTPIFEYIETFVPVGADSDLWLEELFDFKDKGGRHLTLRPEGTAAVMRAIQTHNLLANGQNDLRLFYLCPMFRYDRPQAGRYRQHIQFGVEMCTSTGKAAYMSFLETIEIIGMLLDSLGIKAIELKFNYIGNKDTREQYKKDLYKALVVKKSSLSGKSQSKLETNVLQCLDSKEAEDWPILASMPTIDGYLSEQELQVLQMGKEAVSQSRFYSKVTFSPYLMRGLEYYDGFVFEVVPFSESTQSQNAIAGGGEYEILPGNKFIGFGMGIERVVKMLNEKALSVSAKCIGVVVDRKLQASINTYKTAYELVMRLWGQGVSARIYWNSLWNKSLFESALCNRVTRLVRVDDEEEYVVKPISSQYIKGETKEATFSMPLDDLVQKLTKLSL